MSFRRQTSRICPSQAEFHKSPVCRWLPGVPTLRKTRWSCWWSPLTPGSHPLWSQVEGQAGWYHHGLAWPEARYLGVAGTPSKHHNLQENGHSINLETSINPLSKARPAQPHQSVPSVRKRSSKSLLYSRLPYWLLGTYITRLEWHV